MITMTRQFMNNFMFFMAGGGGSGSLLPTDFVAHYLARINNLATVPTNSVEKWFDTSAKSYGSEEVTNGDFSDGDTDWGTGVGWSISGGQATSAGGNNGQQLSQDLPSLQLGIKYIITITYSEYTSGDLTIRLGGNSASNNIASGITPSVGTFSYVGEISDLGTPKIRMISVSNPFIGSISNVSVKQVLEGHNDLEQTTSAQQPTYVEGYKGVGDEKVTNGDFDTDTDWDGSSTGGWDISGGSANFNGQSYADISQPCLEVGKEYIAYFDITVVTGGVKFGTASGSINDGVNQWDTTGVYTSDVFTAETTELKIARSSPSITNEFSINSVSVKLAQRDTSLDTVLFDGSDDNMVGLPPQSGDFSYVFRGIKFNDEITSYETLVGDSTDPSYSQINVNSSGRLALLSDQSNTYNINGMDYTLLDTLIVTKTGSLVSVYSNGVFTGSVDIGLDTLALVDSVSKANRTLNGTLEELGVYDRALTLEEIEKISGIDTPVADTAQAHYPLSSIITTYSLNDPVSEWGDETGNGFTLVQPNADNQPIFTGTSVKFDGVNDYMTGLPLETGDFSIVFRGLVFGPSGGTEVLLTKDDDSVPTIRMFTSGLLTARTTEGNQVNLLDYSEFRESIHNLAFIKNGDQIETWVDRVKLNTATIPSGELLLNQVGRISSSFNGEITDEIYVFDYALDDQTGRGILDNSTFGRTFDKTFL